MGFSPEELVRRAENIRALLHNETFTRLIEEAEEDCTSDWKAAKTVEQREAAWQQVQGIRAIVKRMQIDVDRGAQAAKHLRGQQPAPSNN